MPVALVVDSEEPEGEKEEYVAADSSEEEVATIPAAAATI